MAAKLVNNVKIAILNTGTGALQLGSAIEGYRGVEALTNGEVYSYSIRQNAAFEYGRGTYLASGQQLLRQPGFSSDGGPAINLQPGAQVSFVALAEDITSPPSLYPLSGEGPPPNEIGDVGQFYRDIASDAQLEYGPKTDTGWGLPRPLAGRPGGSNATYASLADLSGQTVPDGTDLIWIADQAESYIRDAAVNSDYLAANPETSGLDAAGQGFRRADPLREALASNLGAGLVKFSPASNYDDDTIGGKAALIADLRDQAGADDGARIGAWVTDLTLGGRVKLPLGNVTLAAGQVISGNSFHLDGAGANATVINYNGSGAALKYLKPGAGGGFFGGINNVGFYSTTTTAKTAIEAENAAGLEIHHIVISTGNWLGSSAIGIKASGREFVNPNTVNPTSGAYGIGQWLGPRKRALFARYGRNPSLDQQLAFLVSELQGGDRGGPSVLRQTTADSALTAAITKLFRPQGANWEHRADWMGDIRRGRAYLNRGASATRITTGPITINTRATDARGVARDLHGELRKRSVVAQADGGVAY